MRASSALRRFKDEVKEVNAGQECGMAFENYSDLKQGDVIECTRSRKSPAVWTASHGVGCAWPSQRQLRVGEVIRQRLAEVLARDDLEAKILKKTSITVTEVCIHRICVG